MQPMKKPSGTRKNSWQLSKRNIFVHAPRGTPRLSENAESWDTWQPGCSSRNPRVSCEGARPILISCLNLNRNGIRAESVNQIHSIYPGAYHETGSLLLASWEDNRSSHLAGTGKPQ